MPNDRSYYIAFFDADGKFIGYYGEDSHSGGYPWMPDRIEQARAKDYDDAIAIAEDAFNWNYYGYANVAKSQVVVMERVAKMTYTRNQVASQKKAREISEREEKIRILQEEIELLHTGKVPVDKVSG